MELNLAYIPGITKEEVEKLNKQGIWHTNKLLHYASIPFDRQQLAKRTGISPGRLLEFARYASLVEISGIYPYLKYLLRVGISGPKVLRRSTPEELLDKLSKVMPANRLPSYGEVAYWISQARCIDILEEEGEEPPASLTSPSVLDVST
jgi:hypothetical protein